MALTKSIQAVLQGSPISSTYQPVAAEVTTLLTEITDGHLPRLVLNSDGLATGPLLIGSASEITGHTNASVQVQGLDAARSEAVITRFSANSSPPNIGLAKSRGATAGDYTIVQSGDYLGTITFYGADGATTAIRSAQIRSFVYGTPAAGNVQAGIAFLVGSGADAMTVSISLDNNVVTTNYPVKLPSYTVATLPLASAVGAGAMAYVTDSSVVTFNSNVAGGGANKIKVTSDGTNWKVG